MIYLFPLLLLLIGLGFVAVQARQRRGKTRFLDLGQAFLIVVLVYGMVPGLGFLLAHVGVGQIIDSRLAGGYDVSQIERVQWMFICFATSFAVVYNYVRRYEPVAADHRASARKPARWLTWLAATLVVGLPFLLGAAGSSVGDDYISSYTALRSAPLIVQQLFGIVTQLSFSATVAAIVYSIAARPERHLRVAGILVVYLLYATLAGGSRSMAFLSFFAYLVAASIYVRGFTFGRVVLVGVPALVLFMLAGLLRDNDPDGNYLGLLQTGEFTALFINAIDLQDRFDSGFASEFRFAFYFVDLIRLIPSQLLGGGKLDPAQWYVATFYEDYYDAGGGLAFGLLAESVAGMGAVEAIVRGALLAFIFAWAANRLMGRRVTVTRVFIYTWLVVLAYQSYRDTTLSLVVRAMYQLLPLLALLALTQPSAKGARRSALDPARGAR